MKRKRYTEEQIIRLLKEHEAESAKLKKLLAETLLEKSAVEAALQKVVNPAARRKLVGYLQADFDLRQRRTCRLYTALGMHVRTKRRKKLVRPRIPMTVPARPNERWSMDFAHDQPGNGPEMTSKAMFFSSQDQQVKLDFVQPGKLTQNAFVESSTRGLAQASAWT